MGVCFLCDAKLYGERTRVCSSITPHSNVPYPEKIVELMGEEFVVVVTPSDHMCKRCTSLLTHMDKLENDLKLVKNAMLSYIQKKYGILPADQPVKTLDIVNGHLKTEELEVGQKKVPSGLTIRDNAVNSPLKMIKTQQPPNQQESSSKIKIYKCGFCTFQSKELGHVRFHMRTHMNKKGENEKSNQNAAKTALAPVPQAQKKRLYRCQVCSASFDSRMSCLDHIQKDHNQHTIQAAAANEEKVVKEAPAEGSKVFKQEVLKSQDDRQEEETSMEVDNQQEENKGTVDTDMLLNEHVPAEEPIATENNAKPESAEEPANPDKTATSDEGQVAAEQAEEAVPAQEVDQGVPDNVEKGVEGDLPVGSDENKTGDLDIESMLAAIHNDNPPPESSDTQNVA